MDSDWHLTRQAGMRQAEALPEEELEELLRMAEGRKRRKRWRGLKRFLALLLTAFLADGVLYAMHFPLQSILPLTGFTIFSGWLLVLLPLSLFALEQQAYPTTLDVCVQTQRPRFLGAALIRLRMLQHVPVDESGTATRKRLDRCKATLDALTTMLRAVNETQAPTLTREQHALLLHALEQEIVNQEFALAALSALPFCGQEDALPFLRRLQSRAELSSEIWEAARECCTALTQRLDEARQAHSLLRASDISTVAAMDTLLRAAAPTGSDSPEQLLRSSSAEE